MLLTTKNVKFLGSNHILFQFAVDIHDHILLYLLQTKEQMLSFGPDRADCRDLFSRKVRNGFFNENKGEIDGFYN